MPRRRLLLVAFLLLVPGQVLGQDSERRRARDLGIPFDGTPGRWNAITDVAGVEVGHATIIEGEGRLRRGEGPVRTGVTAVLPRGRAVGDTVFAAWSALNGNGEMTGTIWIDESGLLEGPVLITNTHSVGLVRDAVIAWMMEHRRNFLWALPVVAETYDGVLNDVDGFHVRSEHAFAALDGARTGPVLEGAVGGGTGMICHGFKGGIGTASRVLEADDGGYVVGALVQCNYGSRRELSIAGVPVGAELGPLRTICHTGAEPPSRPWLAGVPSCTAAAQSAGPADPGPAGSIIVIVATDAPLLPHQLERIARRVDLAIGRMGGKGENSSGDIFLAFSTANRAAVETEKVTAIDMLPNDRIDPLFYATVQAVEEAIVNALVAAETMVGVDDVRVMELPEERVREILGQHGRLGAPGSSEEGP